MLLWSELVSYFDILKRVSVGSDAGCQSRGCEFEPPARPTFFPTFDKIHCDTRHSSFTNGLTVYGEKQPVAMKVCCVEYWCEKTRKHTSRLGELAAVTWLTNCWKWRSIDSFNFTFTPYLHDIRYIYTTFIWYSWHLHHIYMIFVTLIFITFTPYLHDIHYIYTKFTWYSLRVQYIYMIFITFTLYLHYIHCNNTVLTLNALHLHHMYMIFITFTPYLHYE